MKQYIDKATVMAEIERLYKKWEMGNYVYEKLISFLDTIEVKEVDLEKEANKAWNYIFSHGWDENSRMALKHDEYMAFAQHFFELGINAQESKN